MSKAKGYVGRKAAKATVRHTVRGTVSKARRDPVRSGTLLGAGIVIGVLVGWSLHRLTSSPSPAAHGYATPPQPPAGPQADPDPQPTPAAA